MIRQQVPDTRLTQRKSRGNVYEVRWVDPLTGKERRISTRTENLREAKIFQRHVENKLEKGIDPFAKGIVGSSDMEWSEFLKEYRAQRLPLLRPRVQDQHNSRLKICTDIAKPRTLQAMAPKASLRKIRDSLLRSDRSSQTVKSYLSTLVAVLNWAYECDWLPAKITAPKLKVSDSDRGRPLEDSEVERYLAAIAEECPHDPNGWVDFAKVMLFTGLRLREALELSHDKTAAIKVKGDEIHVSGRIQKNGKKQELPILSDEMLEILSRKSSGYVVDFVGVTGVRPKLDWAGAVLRYAGLRSSIEVSDSVNAKSRDGTKKHVSAHDLRRTCLQRWADEGMQPMDLMHMARHSDLKVTMKYYTKQNNRAIKDRYRAGTSTF